MSRDMGSGAYLCAVLCVLCMKIAAAVDIHFIYDHTPIEDPLLIFNASIGPGWSYKLDRINRKQSLNDVLLLDASSGSLYLHNINSICSNLRYNPVLVNIVARSHLHEKGDFSMSNHSIVPLAVYFHNLRCEVPSSRLWYNSEQINTHQLLLFTKDLATWEDVPCIDKNKVLFYLNNYIPLSLRETLFCDVLFDESSDFVYNSSNSAVLTQTVSCLFSSQISINMKLIPCDQSKPRAISFKVSIHDILSMESDFSVIRPSKHNGRLKRQTQISQPPEFDKTEYEATIQENLPAGRSVIQITATDPDTGEAGKIEYRINSIRDERSNDMFTINPISGLIKTTQELDRETIPKHEFSVTATDNSPYRKSAVVTLVITVEDENDQTPTFKNSLIQVEKSENIPVSSTLTTIRAIDGDIGRNSDIRYSIIDPPNQDMFRMDPTSGSLYTLKTLDRESQADYTLKVQAVDQAPFGEQKSSTATVEITVLDENDNFPQFDQTSYTANVSENLDVSSKPVIGYVSATDADEGRNQDITYSITGGNTDSTFYIDPTTGQVSVQKALDFEEQKLFSLKIKASDNGVTAKANSTTLMVHVLDINDNDPYFQSQVYTGSVLENKPVGSSVLTVYALDRDSGVNKDLTYSILDPPPSLPFVIDEESGTISVRSKLDREITSSYAFTVQVKDGGKPSLSATARVDITVRDVNDNHPVFPQKTFYKIISEETPLNKRIIQLTANDADEGDNALISYVFVGGNTDRMFSIGVETGIITLAKELDYKTVNRYILIVQASDGENFDKAEVHINVTDTNKHRPEFENLPYSLNVNEGDPIGKSIGKVLAVDNDVGENGRVTYELLNDVEEFNIDHNTGEIFIREVLDRELQAAHSFEVMARDHGDPVKSDTASVLVVVNDKNDNPPVFTQTSYSASISEIAYDGEFVTSVSADDADFGINAQVQYRFADGSDGTGDFEVDGSNGDILVAKGSDLDREVKSSYNLTIWAVDGGVIPQTGTVEVFIKVTDVNDNAPAFASDQIIASVAENTKIGSTVALISAVDPDEGINANIEYSVDGGVDADKFHLKDHRPGDPAILLNLVDLDYESDQKEYIIILKAASGTLFSLATIIIRVQDVNDNKPNLRDFSIIFNNYVDNFISGPIGRVPAHDPDVSDKDKLRYSFVIGNDAGFLQLNETSGEITLDSRLNSDVPRNGTIQVSVTDGLNEVRATCRLYVRLVTEEMLQNSVTIRINNMQSDAFLSPLFKFFVEALAQILHVDKHNIFVINVRNDIDVSGQILNVTVSVREKSVKLDRHKRDVYYPAEFLQEQIYLHRMLFANLSTLQVLPFDDNLCLQEPCGNIDICLSWLKFGEAAPFITSDTMLFRPIYPKNGYKCSCPKGFGDREYENSCDTEVDLCFSNPCNGSGTCYRKEGGYTCQCHPGFTGENCEVDMSRKYNMGTCPPGVCQAPSRCVPLIEGGFRCEGCPNSVDYDQFCQLTTIHFPKGSFLVFPTLKSRYRFNIQLKFSTQMKNGLLFYNGRLNEMHDFIALEIIDGQLQLSFSLGSNISRVSPYIENGVNDGKWHHVTVDYLNLTATVSVGEDCDPEIAVLFGKDINYTCAARVKHQLAPICASASSNCQKFFDLTGPLQIGGVPTLPSNFQLQNKAYIGCMKEFYLDYKLMDFNKAVANNGSEPGCKEKSLYCASSPCQHGGTCREGWGTYICTCPNQWGGKDCSQEIDVPRQLRGNGYLHYDNALIPRVHFPWYNGVSFRTRSDNGTLMYITAEKSETIHMELVDGYVTYTYTNSLDPQVFVFDSVRVNDGQWHFFETRWMDNGHFFMVLDYGERVKLESIQSSLSQRAILDVYIGALKLGNTAAQNYFTGCVENVRVGNTQNAVLLRPDLHNAPEGCMAPNLCNSNPCNVRAECISYWEDYECRCPPGTMGPDCKSVCTNYNPCQNMAYCRHQTGASYECECGQLQSGQYCEVVAEQPCTKGWWGYPVCGPCPDHCTRDNGFNPVCNNVTGKCSCLENYYQPAGSSECLPCNCYSHGSQSLQCDVTGQCPCIEGVIGKRCDQCPSKYAEIRLDEDTEKYACKVDYGACPRIYSHGMWWDSEIVNVMVIQNCPNNAVGQATRNCSGTGLWLEPDLFNCTSPKFLDHLIQIEKVESGTLKINTFVAKTMVAGLADSTSQTEKMFGNDLNITLRILNKVLDYEVNQTGLNLTSEQDSSFLSNILSVLSDILVPEYKHEWKQLNKEGEGTQDLILKFFDRMENIEEKGENAVLSDILVPEYKHEWKQLNNEGEGTQALIVKLEHYLGALLSALDLTTIETPRPYNVITENIVLAVDTLDKQNYSGRNIPKYDNIVKSPMYDESTNVFLPPSILDNQPLKDFLDPVDSVLSMTYVGYIMYKHLGTLLPEKYSSNIRVLHERPMDINSPVFTLLLIDNDQEVTGPLSEPLVFTFKQLQTENRTSPQCVYWEPAENSGRWSSSGCEEVERYQIEGDYFVKCSCNHLSSYALLMDISDTEYVPVEKIQIEVIMYIGLIICMSCLLLCFIIFLCLKRIQSNSTSIHTNLVFVMFVAELAFLIGIDKVEQVLYCRLVAITLHYFFMAGFSWLFVDVLHIYRMLTEVRNINQGSMKFYYLIAYVIPGIIVSLAVGLKTESYGTSSFCWLSMEDKFIWSFAGPITVSVIVTVFTFFLAFKASCREKVSVSDLVEVRLGLVANIVILMLWGIIWVVGLLTVNFSYPVLHYIYSIFCLALGVFIFAIYILAHSKVRLELKKLWYKIRGQKLDLDDNIGGTRSSVYSKSALAYRNDSVEGPMSRINVGISTTSTTSRSTSKSSGGIYKGEEYLRSVSSSTSGGPSMKYPKNNGLHPPYGYNPEKGDELDHETIQIRAKGDGNDSDSDSEMSERVSLDLASSHSSDDDDDMDVRMDWEKQLPKNKKIEEALEQAKLKQKEEMKNRPSPAQDAIQLTTGDQPHYQVPTSQHHYQNPFEHIYTGMTGNPSPPFQSKPASHTLGQWPGDPQLTGSPRGSDTDYRGSDQPTTLSSIQPDVTLQTPEYKGRDFVVSPPRSNSFLNQSNSSQTREIIPSPFGSPNLKHSPREATQSPLQRLGSPLTSPNKMTVKVLTHRGSITSDSESEDSHETCV